MADNFVHLHVHSISSMLDGMASVQNLVKKAKSLDMKALALTNHGNLFDAITFYAEAQKAGIKPIQGVEFNFVEDCVESKAAKMRQISHVTVLAENATGWRNLIHLVSESNNGEAYYYKPRIDFKLLEKYKEGLIVLTGCAGGIVAKYLHDADGNKSIMRAEALLRRLMQIFDADHLYLEVQNHYITTQEEINNELRRLSTKYGLKTVATNNVHYINREDYHAHSALLNIAETMHTRHSYSPFTCSEYYLKSKDELNQCGFTQEELDITGIIADRCNVDIDLKKKRLPSYEKFLLEGYTSQETLVHLVYRGLQNKNLNTVPVYQERAEKELSDIHEMGFDDYFLIVHDVMNWCRTQKIFIGPGRGSVGGSLVAYALGITDIDPIKYNLIWERFLNKGRGGLPDIDTDVQRSKRGLVLQYIKDRFGSDTVAQLPTFSKLAARAVLKDVFRVFGLGFDESNMITNLVPMKNDDHTQISLDEAIKKVPELAKYEEKYKSWFAIARQLEGCYKSLGTHASAVVIADIPFSEGMYPTCKSSDEETIVCGWDMSTVDRLNLLKQDILGLNTLDVLEDSFKYIKDRHGVILETNTIPLNDQATFDLISKGYTIGVFQLESQLGRSWCKKLMPNSVEEVSDLISIIRPGPLDCLSGDTKILIDRYNWAGHRHYIYKTVNELYNEYIKVQNSVYTKGQYIPNLLISSLNEETDLIFKNQIQCIQKTGKKQIFGIKLQTDIKGYKSPSEDYDIKASANHRFLTHNGWKRLHDLKKGDYVCVLKRRFNKNRKNKHVYGWKSFKEIAFQNYQYNCVFCDWNEGSLDVNHLEGNRYTNNHPDNLCYMCPNHHRLYSENKITKDQIVEAREKYKLLNNDDVIYLRINEIVPFGEEETYDICVKGPHHNFIAGNFIVHNSGMAKQYFESKMNGVPPTYLHPSLASILNRTHGTCLYQEQVIEICKVLAEMSLEDADAVRKAMGKKKPEEMAKWKDKFIVGCTSNKQHIINNEQATSIWEFIEVFSGYGFNLAHGLGYALLSYYTAYIKANFPVEFFCAQLNNSQFAQDALEEIQKFVNDGKLFDIQVLPPSIKSGNLNFQIQNDLVIAFGLSCLKGIGEKTLAKLVKSITNINIENYDDFLWTLIKAGLNVKVVEALMKSGAFDCFDMPRCRMWAKYSLLSELTAIEQTQLKLLLDKDNTKDWIGHLRALSNEAACMALKNLVKIPNVARRESIRQLLLNYDATDPFDGPIEKIGWEKYYLGISLTGSETDLFKSRDKCKDIIKSYSMGYAIDTIIQVAAVRQIKTKKNDDMAFVTGGDNTCQLDNIVVFPQVFVKYRLHLNEGNILRLKGKIGDGGSIIVDHAERLK